MKNYKVKSLLSHLSPLKICNCWIGNIWEFHFLVFQSHPSDFLLFQPHSCSFFEKPPSSFGKHLFFLLWVQRLYLHTVQICLFSKVNKFSPKPSIASRMSVSGTPLIDSPSLLIALPVTSNRSIFLQGISRSGTIYSFQTVLYVHGLEFVSW